MILLRTLFSMVSAMAFLLPFMAAELGGDGVGDAGLHDQIQQPHVVEGRDLPRLVGLDVGVDEVAHVRLVGLEVEALAAGLADDLAHVQVVVELPLDAGDVGGAVAGGLQLVGDVGVGAHQGHGGLVERGPLRLPLLQIGRDLGVAAEVVDVLQLALGRLHRLAEQGQRLQRVVEALLALLQAILQAAPPGRPRPRCGPAPRCRPRWRSRPS